MVAFCAAQPTSNLRDGQTLLIAVVAGELRRSAAFRHTVNHQNLPNLPDALDSQPKRRKRSIGVEFPSPVPRRAGDSELANFSPCGYS